MSEEKKTSKQVKIEFVTDSELPVLFVNTANVLSGSEEFYITLGTAQPLEVKDAEALENIDTVEAHPYFRFAVTRTTMRQLIDLMENVYKSQSQQIDVLRQSQRREEEDS